MFGTKVESLTIGEATHEIARLRAENERLTAEAVEWKKAAGKYAAGCPCCDEIAAENDRLVADNAALAQSLQEARDFILRAAAKGDDAMHGSGQAGAG